MKWQIKSVWWTFVLVCGGATSLLGQALDDAGLSDALASIADADGVTLVRSSPEERPTPATQPVATAPVEQSLLEREQLAGDLWGVRSKLASAGLSVQSDLTTTFQKNVRGGLDTDGSSFQHLFNFNLTVDTEKLVGLHGGTLFLNFQNQSGQSPADEAGAYQSLSPIDADGRTQLSEIWYEQKLASDHLRVKVGKIDVNTELAVSEFGSLFSTGGLNVSPNIPLPTYPDPAFGGLVVVNFTDNLYAAFGVFDGAAQEGYATGELGPKTLFGPPSDLFFIGEIGAGWTIKKTLPGRAIVGTWRTTGTLDKFDGATIDGTAGVYTVIEQTVYRESTNPDDIQGLGLFVQAGLADADVSEAPVHVAGGAVYHGLLESRDADVIGAGVSCVWFSSQAGFNDDVECAYELFYKLQATPFLTIKPGVQYIVNPGGNDTPDALAFGITANVTF